MRKFFATLFVVLIATAIHAKLYNFAGIQATDIVTAGTIGTYTMDGVEIPSVSAAAGTDINCTIYGMDDMVINYSNSSGKSNILKFAVDFLQADGKNVILTFSNVTIGDEIVLLVSAKGSTSATFEALSGCVADANNPASVEKKESIADYAEMRFQAIANEVQIKETSGGFRIITATIGESSAQEVSGTCGDNLTWYLNMSEGVLNISGYGAMYDYNSIDDVPWTNYREYITAISIPDGMTNIGDYAFWNCYNLTSLTIGQNVSNIGNYALYGCFALTEINVASANSTFSSENGVLFNADKTTLIQYPIGKTEGTYTIPSNVNRIGNTAFSYSPYLTSVSIPGSVTNIGIEAFSYCIALNTVSFQEGVTTIDYAAFGECSSLQSISIPNSVETIGDYALYNCYNLSSVTIGDGVTTIGEYAFASCTSLVELNVLPITPPTIYSNTFDSELNSSFAITVPEGSLEDYRNDANWRKLLDIAAGEVSGICGDNLTWVLNMENGTLTIFGYGAMYDYTSSSEVPWNDYRSDITSVSMPEGMTSIGGHVFEQLSLSSVSIPTSVTNIGAWAFRGSNINSITIPENVASIGDQAFYECYSLTSIDVDERNGYYSSENGVLFNKDKTQLIRYPVAKSDATYSIPNSVTALYNYAFSDCHSLNTIVIPNDVTNIGDYVFAWCSNLQSVTIGSGVTSMGESAFRYCGSLVGLNVLAVVPPSIYSSTFDSELNSSFTITVPEGSQEDYRSDENWRRLLEIASGESSGVCGENLVWTLNLAEGTLTISGSGGMYDYTYAEENPWYEYRSYITNVSMPAEMTSIGNYAFYDCYNLSSVTIGSGVTSIGEYAFRYCGSLVELNVLPVTPPSIYSNTFDSELNSSFAITVPEGSLEDYRSDANWRRLLDIAAGEVSGICGENLVWTLNLTEGTLTISGSGAMYDYTYAEENPWYGYRSYITSVSMPDEMTGIGNNAFYNCYNLASVTIGSSVTSIGESAFSNCYSLNAMVIPDNVTSIGNYAFAWCGALQSATIGDEVTSIGNYAFYNCYNLSSVTIGSGVTSIGEYAFADCYSLSAMVIPDNVTTIGSRAFDNCYNLSSLIIGSGVTSIGEYAFSDCNSLNTVVIPDNVTAIGNSAFYNCYNLSSLTIGSGVTSIGESAFRYCSSLNAVVIPDNVTTIGSRAFDNCYNLSSLTIGSGVISIGEYAFRNCGSLVELTVLAIVPPSIYSNTFDSELNSSFTISVPEGSLEDYRNDENWRRLLEWSAGEASGVCGDNLVWTLNIDEGTLTISGSGAMYDYSYAEEVPWYDYRSYITNVSMPAEMTSIGNYAFYNCYNLSSLTIGSGVTSIGEYAFADCYSLNAVVIPDNVTTIGEYAFVGCYDLTSITCLAIVPPAVNDNFVSINPANCMLYVPQTAMESYRNDPVWSLFLLEGIETETPIEIYQLMLTVGENGSVLYDGTIFTSEFGTVLIELQEGTTPTIQILPNQGYGISSITMGELDLTGQTDEDGYITLPAMMGNTNCTVLFEEARYKVEYYFVGSHGSFYTTVAYGGSFTCYFMAHAGNVIESITLNGTDVTDWMENDNSITINDITEDMILIISTNDYNTNNQSVKQSRLRAWQAEKTIFAEVDETVKTVVLYDISGRLMREYYHNGDYQVLTFPAPNQVNLLKVVTKDGTVITHKLM